MTVKNGNFRNQATPSEIDASYESCAFAHDSPVNTGGVMTGNILFPGDDTPRTFTCCNLVNCEPPPGSTLIKCNTSIVENGKVVGSDDVIIDGETLSIPILENWIHGKYNHETEDYFYHPEIIKVSK